MLLLQCRPVTTPVADPLSLVVDDRARARAANDPMTDLCVLATTGPADRAEAPGVRPIVLRDIGAQGIGLLISGTSPKWEPLSSGRYELLLLWLTIRRQYRVRGTIAPMPDATIETYWNQKVHASRLLDVYYATYGAQSTAVASRDAFLHGIDAIRQQYPTPEAVPRPELLRGVYLVPERIEVWRGSPDRLHDRRRFFHEATGWREETLVP
jgi:pyridoxamine 5'-phosphate oxidase